MKSKFRSTRKRHHASLEDNADGDTVTSRPSKKRKIRKRDHNDSENGCSQTMLKKPQPYTKLRKQASDSEKTYLNTKEGFMESYSKLLGLREIFQRVMKKAESSSDSEVSDYSISSFEDPASDEEPLQQVPASTFVISTKIRRKDGTEKIISSSRTKSAKKSQEDYQSL